MRSNWSRSSRLRASSRSPVTTASWPRLPSACSSMARSSSLLSTMRILRFCIPLQSAGDSPRRDGSARKLAARRFQKYFTTFLAVAFRNISRSDGRPKTTTWHNDASKSKVQRSQRRSATSVSVRDGHSSSDSVSGSSPVRTLSTLDLGLWTCSTLRVPFLRMAKHGKLQVALEYALARAILSGLGDLPRRAGDRRRPCHWPRRLIYCRAICAALASAISRSPFRKCLKRERDRLLRGCFASLGRLLGEFSQLPQARLRKSCAS